MIRKLVAWSLDNPLIVLLLAFALAGVGLYSFANVNVEAYPDPAPAIVEVVAQMPGASAEEVERQVTIPLEVTLAGMPNLKVTRSKSLFGLAHLRNQFEYGFDFEKARQEVINRLQFTQNLPTGVTPQISPASPTGEIFRYTLKSPKDRYGNDVYTLNDLKALQDWVLEREFRRVPRIIDVTSSGGTVKRYEIHIDPERLQREGITLGQLQAALTNSNANVGADNLTQGDMVLSVRSNGLIGGGRDSAEKALGLTNPLAAAQLIREEENRRCWEIRQLVIVSRNNRPVRINDLVEGGPIHNRNQAGKQGVVVGFQTRLGRVSLSKPAENHGKTTVREDSANSAGSWRDEPDKVQCIVLLRKGEDSGPALADVRAKVAELNDPASGKLLPGVVIEKYYDRGDLTSVTTETVEENLLVGIGLVTMILLMFLGNVRTAFIVAINIPLALLVAFMLLFFRGKSANLLSIGAVDFGIIVDSSVIMVENVYRHLASGDRSELPLKARIWHAAAEIDRALLFSTMIMICAFIPLFTMRGPEGQLFGPMADTYAFALGGALLLAVTLFPVLCLLFLGSVKQIQDNAMVRFFKRYYISLLHICLKFRWVTLTFMIGLVVITGGLLVAKRPDGQPFLGREFMPELEEGNLWITATFPLNMSMDRVATDIDKARAIIASFPEVEVLVPSIGRPDDGTDPTGYYRAEIFAPLRPMKDWPKTEVEQGWKRRYFGSTRARTKEELVSEMNQKLRDSIPGVDWNFSQYIRDNVTEALSGVKGDNAVKIFGPDLDKLEEIAEQVKNKLRSIQGIEDVTVFSIKGQTNLEFRIDLEKCAKWGVSAADVNNVVQTAIGGTAQTKMIEGEKQFDVTLRLPKRLRGSENSILDIQLDIVNNQLFPAGSSGSNLAASGTGAATASSSGSQTHTSNPITNTPRIRLRELVSPVGRDGAPDPKGDFVRPGASTIYREQGKRMIAVKFSVRGRDLASTVDDAKEKTRSIIETPYRAEWAGEFQEMEAAETRLMVIVPLSLAMIFVLLYMAFNSLLDAVVVFSNVLALSLGGVWALMITQTNFSISAAVGFVSLFGVAIMDGLLLISSFNQYRAEGMELEPAILKGSERRVRAGMMTALTAILGLLPAAVSTRIGAQTQRPLAIVVVGGMITTLFLTRYLMPVLYSFYGHREPPAGSGSMAH